MSSLLDSEAKYRGIFNTVRDALLVYDRDYIIVEANPAACHTYGYTVKEFVGMTARDIVHPDYYYLVEKSREEILQNGYFHAESIDLRKDGSAFHVEVTAAAILVGGKEHVLVIARDISQRKQVEDALRKSEEKMAALFASMTEMVVIHKLVYDGQGKPVNYLITDCNRAYTAITGISKEEAVGRLATEVYREEEAPYLVEYSRVATTGQPFYFETYFSPMDKHFYISVVSPGKDSFATVTTDITPVKKAEEALRRAEAKYRTLVNNSQSIIYTLTLDGTVTFVSPSWKSLLGHEPQAIRGTKFIHFMHQEDRSAWLDCLKKTEKAGTVQPGVEYRVYHRDGSIRWHRSVIAPVLDNYQYLSQFVGNALDITEMRTYVEKLQYLSMHDALTGLYNRAYFNEEMRRMEASREYPVTIISADLDGLKLINDNLGHARGDELIQKGAKLLKQSLRKTDILARLGGDEFAIILPSTDNQTGIGIMERISHLVDKHNKENLGLPVSISLGLATSGDRSISLEKTLKTADDYMYQDKLDRKEIIRERIVDWFLAALDERDYMAEGHGERIAGLCMLMGEELGLGHPQLNNLLLLALMHDLGKVAVPDEILFKKGPLTEKEWEIIKQHTEKGYYIARLSPELEEIAELILKHHEHWDGGGYPQGLKGESIPLECRIFAVADAFEVMTSHRPYREAKSVEEALAELKEKSGTQFEPGLVEVFLKRKSPGK